MSFEKSLKNKLIKTKLLEKYEIMDSAFVKLYSANPQTKSWLYSEIKGLLYVCVEYSSKKGKLFIFNEEDYSTDFEMEFYRNFHEAYKVYNPLFQYFQAGKGFLGLKFKEISDSDRISKTIKSLSPQELEKIANNKPLTKEYEQEENYNNSIAALKKKLGEEYLLKSATINQKEVVLTHSHIEQIAKRLVIDNKDVIFQGSKNDFCDLVDDATPLEIRYLEDDRLKIRDVKTYANIIYNNIKRSNEVKGTTSDNFDNNSSYSKFSGESVEDNKNDSKKVVEKEQIIPQKVPVITHVPVIQNTTQNVAVNVPIIVVNTGKGAPKIPVLPKSNIPNIPQIPVIPVIPTMPSTSSQPIENKIDPKAELLKSMNNLKKVDVEESNEVNNNNNVNNSANTNNVNTKPQFSQAKPKLSVMDELKMRMKGMGAKANDISKEPQVSESKPELKSNFIENNNTPISTTTSSVMTNNISSTPSNNVNDNKPTTFNNKASMFNNTNNNIPFNKPNFTQNDKPKVSIMQNNTSNQSTAPSNVVNDGPKPDFKTLMMQKMQGRMGGSVMGNIPSSSEEISSSSGGGGGGSQMGNAQMNLPKKDPVTGKIIIEIPKGSTNKDKLDINKIINQANKRNDEKASSSKPVPFEPPKVSKYLIFQDCSC